MRTPLSGWLRAATITAIAATAAASAGAAAPAAQVSAEPLRPEAALERVVRRPWSSEPMPSPEAVAEARRVLEAAAAREPSSLKWAFGLAHAARLEARSAAGDAAAQKRKDAKERFAAIVERAPNDADHQYWLGATCFEMIDDVGTIAKMSIAGQGRHAFEKAIELDPNHFGAHYALGTFFAQAPAIVGGSTSKAKAQGQALLALPGGRGAYWGRMLLARIAVDEKDWAEMSRQYTAAETAEGEGANPAGALSAHAGALLLSKKDPAAAIPVIARYRAAAKPDDTAVDFFEGEAQRQLGRCAEAVAAYERVLAKNPAAQNTRYGIAECQEKLGRRDEARKNYEEFARRFPKDDRAGRALQAAKRLR